MGSITSSLSAYKLQRNNFISTYRRDKLGSVTAKDRKIIRVCNASVHGGDVIIDAMLYSSTGKDGRRDVDAYERLYGMDPLRVLSISELPLWLYLLGSRLTCTDHKSTIAVLNTHAGVAASQYQKGSARFSTLFTEFVRLFKESGYDESYLSGDATEVTCAYWEFFTGTFFFFF
jgi:hypothetical protein